MRNVDDDAEDGHGTSAEESRNGKTALDDEELDSAAAVGGIQRNESTSKNLERVTSGRNNVERFFESEERVSEALVEFLVHDGVVGASVQ